MEALQKGGAPEMWPPLLSRLRRSQRQHSLFIRTLLYLCMVVLLVAVTINVGWNLYVQRLALNQTQKNLVQYVEQMQMSVDAQLQVIDDQAIQLGLQSWTTELESVQTAAQAGSILEGLRDDLANWYENASIIDGIYVFVPKFHMMETMWSTQSLKHTFQLPTGPKFTAIPLAGEWTILSLDQAGAPSPNPRMALVHPLPLLLTNQSPVAYLVVELNPQALYDTSVLSEAKSGETAWMSRDGVHVFNLQTGNWSTTKTSELIQAAIQKGPVTSDVTVYHRNGAEVSVTRSPQSNWIYGSVYQYKPHMPWSLEGFVFGLLCCLFVLPIVIWLLIRMYKPIRELIFMAKADDWDGPDFHWKGKDGDLTTLYETFSRYRKRAMTLESQLLLSEQRTLLNQLIRHEVIGDRVLNRVRRSLLPVGKCTLVICIMRLNRVESASIRETSLDVLRSHVETQLFRYVGDYAHVVVSEVEFADMVALIIGDAGTSDAELLERLDVCLQDVVSETAVTMGVDMVYRFSDVRHTITESAAAYRQATSRLNDTRLDSRTQGDEILDTPVPAIPGVDPPKSETIVKILDFLNNHYMNEVSLVGLSDMFDMDPTYISRLFKSEVGLGFARYVANLRMHAAGEQLIHEDKTIREISESVGYTNLQTFLRAFKKHFGVTPSEYRDLVARTDVSDPQIRSTEG